MEFLNIYDTTPHFFGESPDVAHITISAIDAELLIEKLQQQIETVDADQRANHARVEVPVKLFLTEGVLPLDVSITP